MYQGMVGYICLFWGKNKKPLYPSRTERFKLFMIGDKSVITQISNTRKAWDSTGKNNKNRRVITALPNTDTGFIAESS